jgi:hypothetical protein
MHQARFVGVGEAAAGVDVDQRRAGAVDHAVQNFRPARFVIAVAENLLIGMAPVAVDGEQPLVGAAA